ncbi:hypothetical protein ASZ90_018578 [hydrocarbon metagenome]|uniref:HTH luxR-type domain-containing protein n=1 Tax=hydrocarbon metagenome TaxID=938273 RepID=A0A0W8E5Z7_9ZZZZ
MYKHSKTRNLYFPKRLTEAMNGILDYPLTFVEAPMGYGKSTAVREHMNNTHRHFLWYKVYDSSLNGFWDGLCSLLSQLDIECSQSLAQLGFPNDRVSRQEALKLIEGIELAEKTVLFINDYHLLNRTEAGSFIETLAVNEISNLYIVLAGRYIEHPNMEELMLKGYLYQITKEAFEFMPNDVIKYYKLCGISIRKAEAEKLYSITEGWISALYLLMLNYLEKGSFISSDSIYKLFDNAVFQQFSNDLKAFMLGMCIFTCFTKEQAVHIYGDEKAEVFLDEIIRKNAFVNYDDDSKTYYVHNIFVTFLQGMLAKQNDNYKKNLYQKAGHWYAKTAEYIHAMHYFYEAGDFENLLSAVELDRGNSFGNEQKELIIKYFEECPEDIKQQNIAALLVYAMALITFNERELFRKACEEITLLIKDSRLDPENINHLMGELELLTSFTRYNDIMGMSQHHQRACELLNKPSIFMERKGSWTFGSPSVLYMFYRESRMLEQHVKDIKEAMPYYYSLTNGHGTGAEYIMEAEWYFNQADFQNAEITVHKGLYQARSANQPNIAICALFLMVRLKLLTGDYPYALDLMKEMNEEIKRNKVYMLIHTIDMCKGFLNACLQQSDKIPQWLAEGDFNSSRLYFPSRAFYNIIYGRVLLINGEYLKLLGTADHFIGIASVFPNILANIYTTIYVAAANIRISRMGEAVEAIKRALDMAMPDQVYMPFVENCDYIRPLLEELYTQDIHRKDIARILEIYKLYQKAVEQIKKEYFQESRPELTTREAEIARLAAEGFSNRVIGEKLFISQNTVKTQLKGIFEKLGINSRSLLRQYIN